MKKPLLLVALMSALVGVADTSEIRVSLRLDAADFVIGERLRGVVDIANSSPDLISVGYPGSKDRFFIEVQRASDLSRIDRHSQHPFVAEFALKSGEGQKLEVFIGDHFALREPRRYLARPVLVHGNIRYEGDLRAFDIVDGVKITGAMQMFANRPGLQRDFTLSYWSRGGAEHLFLSAADAGNSTRAWATRDLGAILRLDPPSISILPSGEVVVLHRLNQDLFVRSEFWSLPQTLEFRKCETVSDPETAGTSRVRELYSDGVKAQERPWWKFW